MKNQSINELEPIQQIGLAAVFFGLDLFCNKGKITTELCRVYAEGCHKKMVEVSNDAE